MKRTYYKEKIKIPNSDTINQTKEIGANHSITDFLYNIGERSAANFLEKRIVDNASTKYSESRDKSYQSNEKIKQKELIKISSTNKGILERLDKIEKNMIDEQNTSLKPISGKTETQPALQIIREESKTEEKGLSWFDMLLGSLLGVGMLAFLKGFKNLGPVKFAISMMEMGWTWLKDKVIDVAKGIADAVVKPLQEILEFILERLAKLPGMDGLLDKYKTAKQPSTDVDPKSKTKPKSGIPEVDAGKLAKSTEKAAAEEIAKVSEKAGGKSLMKKIPFLGLGVAGAFAADRISEGDYVGAGGEIASGLLSIVPVVGTAASFGVDAALLARDIDRMNDAVITKLDDSGIIDKSWIGDTTVEKWDEVRKLPAEELKALAEYDDLNESDRQKVQSILYKKELEKIKVPEAPESFNDGVKIIFNDREILADKLLESDNKLQEFLINNPFTEENSETTETEINGERVKQIKFRDEALNQQYIELKEQYDRDYKKYKDARDSQLRNMQDVQEIEGELLTSEEVSKYKSSGMNMPDYIASTTRGSARQDVLGALGEQYKNIALPTGEIVDRIKKNEGLRLQPYKDSEGYDTIGYGHKIKPGEDHLRSGITQEQADALFAKDFEFHKNAASKIPGFSDAPGKVQDALLDMTFNMGPAWYKGWPETVKKLVAKDYIGVKNDILKSQYATQVKGRALVNAKIFEQAGSGDDVKLASTNVTQPTTSTNTANAANDINKLNRDNAIEQKTEQVQKVEETSRNLSNTVRNVTPSSNTTIVNSQNTTAKAGDPIALSDLFGVYD